MIRLPWTHRWTSDDERMMHAQAEGEALADHLAHVHGIPREALTILVIRRTRRQRLRAWWGRHVAVAVWAWVAGMWTHVAIVWAVTR